MNKRELSLLFFAVLMGVIIACGMCQNEQSDSDSYDSAEGMDPSELTTTDKNENIRIPPGMELRQIGTTKVVVPKGTQVRKERSQMFLEDPDEYMSRNMEELRNRMKSLEDRQSSLEQSLEDIKKSSQVNQPQ